MQRNQDKLLSKRLSEVELFEWNSLILNLEIKKLQFQIYDYQTAPEVYVVHRVIIYMSTNLLQISWGTCEAKG